MKIGRSKALLTTAPELQSWISHPSSEAGLQHASGPWDNGQESTSPVSSFLQRRFKPSRNGALWGFYCYSFAAEIYAIVSISVFLPITLEQFSRDNGFLYPNHHTPCTGPSAISGASSNTGPLCQVQLLGRWFDTASFPLYVSGTSVALQAIVVASLGNAANDPSTRKLLLVFFAVFGSLAGMSFFILNSSSPVWFLSAVLAITSTVSLGSSILSCITLHTFFFSQILTSKSQIPELAKTKANLMGNESSEGLTIQECKVSNSYVQANISTAISEISSKGVAIGFSSGIIALCTSLIPVTLFKGDLSILKGSIGASGALWAIFTIPAALVLPPCKLQHLNLSLKYLNVSKSWKDIGKIIVNFKEMKNISLYLLAWCLLSNAFSTSISVFLMWGKSTMQMPSSHLILLGVILPAFSVLGALLAPIFQKNMDYFSGAEGGIKIFKFVVGMTWSIPTYICLGVFLNISTLATEWEVYGGFFFFFFFFEPSGLLYGPFQAYSRSVYAELIPPGQEAKWYSLFSIIAKISSCIGPFAVGLISNHTHDLRHGFLFILILLMGALPILNYVDMNVGKTEAEKYIEGEYQNLEDIERISEP
ncbi:hypothetical protein CROQUDRAFT_67793 [Cronartium quercuum f. sp. fusiforme G11]|uniref:Autophagy-related protein n=1 Tax=Cronartium quercuum f. sp. fusiforme G11 TaxID=708437 RepID=A0A9P6NCW8_9BASI|nr:hypothetical protein CROQUDRAFT_67793 [Cronartium quercuum f. sp. fusiforme G11]